MYFFCQDNTDVIEYPLFYKKANLIAPYHVPSSILSSACIIYLYIAQSDTTIFLGISIKKL